MPLIGQGGRGGRGARGGRGWNKFESNVEADNRNGNIKLTYTHTDQVTLGDTRRGVRPEDELLAQTNTDKKVRNTETFRPSHEPTEMRVMFSSGVANYPRPILTRDVIFVPDMFCGASDLSIYNNLLSELEHSGLTQHQVML